MVHFRPGRCIWILQVPTDHPALYDADKFRVEEIEIRPNGANSRDNLNDFLKLFVSTSGDFKGRVGDQEYNFMTQASEKVFEYRVNAINDGKSYNLANVDGL